MKLDLKRKDGIIIKAEMKKLEAKDIDKVMKLQEDIIDALDNKELFAPSTEEEFLYYIEDIGMGLGVFTEKDELIAMGVFGALGQDEHNYGYDLNLSKEELFKVGQIESTVVLEDYRGNRLQKIICEELEKYGVSRGMKLMTATASPLNHFSVNTFVNMGYDIALEKIKYGGLRRYVLRKNI